MPQWGLAAMLAGGLQGDEMVPLSEKRSQRLVIKGLKDMARVIKQEALVLMKSRHLGLGSEPVLWCFVVMRALSSALLLGH